MQDMYKLNKRITAVVFFQPEAVRPMCHTVLYQVVLDPEKLSPSGELIRFDQFTEVDGERVTINEIHGWKVLDEIVIQEVLLEDEVSEVAGVKVKKAA